MAGGLVDRTALQSNYQEPGQTYDDKKTEGAIEVLANQADANWQDYAEHNHDDRYYTQTVLDTKFAQVQAGVIVDGTIAQSKFNPDLLTTTLYGLRW